MSRGFEQFVCRDPAWACHIPGNRFHLCISERVLDLFHPFIATANFTFVTPNSIIIRFQFALKYIGVAEVFCAVADKDVRQIYFLN
jgi:hypothetical protein